MLRAFTCFLFLCSLAGAAELKYVAIVSRHGVRAPTWTAERLRQYSAKAWPDFGVPPAELTVHGKTLMELFGIYDRAYLSQAGLISAKGCAQTSRVYFWADTDQRTLATGRALADGMFPGCTAQVHSLAAGVNDPLFHPLAEGVSQEQRNLAQAAVAPRLGDKILMALEPEYAALQRVLSGSTPWTTLQNAVAPAKEDGLIDVTGPLRTASTLTENLLLEYTNGMTGKDLGWGRLDEKNLLQIMALHTAYAELARRTQYVARAGGSNMLSHVVRSLEQAVKGTAVPGSMGKPGDLALVISGHDTNISNLSGMLNLEWLLPGYQKNDAPPGGALILELWRADDGTYSVRAFYTVQSLEQMHQALPLSLKSPPMKAPLAIPGCSTTAQKYSCEWAAFERTAHMSIDSAFVH